MTSHHLPTLLAAGFVRHKGSASLYIRAATGDAPRLLAITKPDHPRGLALWQPGTTHVDAPVVTTQALRQLLERLGAAPVGEKQ